MPHDSRAATLIARQQALAAERGIWESHWQEIAELFTPFRADHGSTDALGFRIGPLAYLPDAVEIPEETWPILQGLDCWIVDALRRKPHPTHAHLSLTLDWIARARPHRAVITDMHIDLDHDTLCAELPPHIRPAFDGMVIAYDNLP